jgi:hypothetical protein
MSRLTEIQKAIEELAPEEKEELLARHGPGLIEKGLTNFDFHSKYKQVNVV